MLSITGVSIFNKMARQGLPIPHWNMMYDIVFDGNSTFEASIPIFVSLIIRYAYYLNKETQCIVPGFFSQDGG
jgi:hypothetical protein